MIFHPPLLRGRLIARYQRFFADVALDTGATITAHTPNTGAMLTCSSAGSVAYVSRSDNPRRKLAYTLELVQSGPALVGVHTGRANDLAAEAIRAGAIAELRGYASLRREVRYAGHSRVDFLLEDAGRAPCFVEVKNVTLARDGVALFPDAVTARGSRHMAALADEVQRGHGACVLFVVQRPDCETMAPADDIDPAYGTALRAAAARGVRVLAYQAHVSAEELRIVRALPVHL